MTAMFGLLAFLSCAKIIETFFFYFSHFFVSSPLSGRSLMCFSIRFSLGNYLCSCGFIFSAVWKIAGAKCGGINIIVRCLCSRRII